MVRRGDDAPLGGRRHHLVGRGDLRGRPSLLYPSSSSGGGGRHSGTEGGPAVPSLGPLARGGLSGSGARYEVDPIGSLAFSRFPRSGPPRIPMEGTARPPSFITAVVAVFCLRLGPSKVRRFERGGAGARRDRNGQATAHPGGGSGAVRHALIRESGRLQRSKPADTGCSTESARLASLRTRRSRQKASVPVEGMSHRPRPLLQVAR